MDIKFYCELCKEYVSVTIEPIATDRLNERPWGDIDCNECGSIIATVSSNVPGKLVFVEEE